MRYPLASQTLDLIYSTRTTNILQRLLIQVFRPLTIVPVCLWPEGATGHGFGEQLLPTVTSSNCLRNDTATTRRLSPYGNIPLVAAEVVNVLLYPLQRSLLI